MSLYLGREYKLYLLNFKINHHEKINLSKLALLKLEKKEMEMVKGQGCSAKCGTDYHAGATNVTKDIRNHAVMKIL